MQENGLDCKRAPYNCHVPTVDAVLYGVVTALLFGYLVGVAFLLRRAVARLRTKPYNQMRMNHQNLRLQARSKIRALYPGSEPNGSCIPCPTRFEKPQNRRLQLYIFC